MPVPISPDTPDGNEEIALSVGLTIGVAGTTIVAVTVCCIWYACQRRYTTQVTWLHYPTKTLPLVFLNSIKCTCIHVLIAFAWFLHLADAFYYRLTVVWPI